MATLKYGLFTEECFDTFFVQNDFFNMSCLKLLISKGLGYAIILGAFAVKIPQIFKIYPSGKVDNIAPSMFILSMVGFSINFAYNFLQGNPLSTYGEAGLIMVQDFIIVFLLHHYTGKADTRFWAAMVCFAAFSAAMMAGFVPAEVMQLLMGLTVPIFSASKIPQIISNFKAGSTGQLSFATSFLQFAGSMARIFTTLSEVDDPLVLTGFLSGGLLNFIIVAQFVWYSGASASPAEDIKKAKARSKAAVDASNSVAANTRSKTPRKTRKTRKAD